MATIQINIPDSIASRVLNAFARRYGYLATFEDGTTNPQTKAEFAKSKLISFIIESVRIIEVQDSSNNAASIASDKVDTEIDIT